MIAAAAWPGIAAAAALAAALWSVRRHAAGFGWRLALLILFQAAVLQLTAAGPSVRYQHLTFPDAGSHRAALAIMALGVLVALVAALRGHRAARAWVSARTSAGAAAIVLAALVAFSAVPTRPAGAWARELAAASLLQLTALVLAVLAAAAAPAGLLARCRAWLEDDAAERGPGRTAWVLAAGVTLVSALLAVVAYERHPHIPDEVSYLLQARYFAHGLLTMPAPPVPAAFDLDLMTLDGARWYSPFPPGWPAVLAIGVRLGVPWLVNPVLGGLAVLLAATLFRDLLERGTARLATLLLALSPWHLFLAMSFMSHTLSLVLTLVAAVGIVRLHRGGAAAWGWAAGAAIGVVSLMRPLEGVAVAGFLGALTLGARGRRFRFAPAAVVAAGAALAGAAGLWYNRLITGRLLTFPVMDYFDRYYRKGVNDLGFGPDRGLPWGFDPFPGHGLRDVVANALLNTTAINVELFGWCVGGVALVALGAALGRRERRTWLWVAAIAVIAGVHSFYWFSGGPDFGARYWFLALVPCVALAAQGLRSLDAGAAPRATAGALLLSAAATVAFIPWRATDKYHDYRGMRPDVRALALPDSALVLVRGRRFPDYASAATYNPADLRGPGTVFAWDRDARTRQAVLAAYPGRPVWVVDGPSVTGEGFRLLAGPMTGAALDSLPEEPQP